VKDPFDAGPNSNSVQDFYVSKEESLQDKLQIIRELRSEEISKLFLNQ
jgi:hypothetical protein